MIPTFITAGKVRREYDDDGEVTCVYVSRKDMGAIRLSREIPEYNQVGVRVVIDAYGSPWVKK